MRLEVDHLHVKSDPKLNSYIDEKLGKLDHLLSRHARRSAHAEVKLKKGPGRGKKQFICEVIMHLPQEIVTTNQTAETLTAAVDLAEAKLKNQLKKYKDKHVSHRRRIAARVARRLRLGKNT
jgi:ribosomal subunit interface protein